MKSNNKYKYNTKTNVIKSENNQINKVSNQRINLIKSN